MERETINIPWRTVRLVAAAIAVACLVGIVAIALLALQLAPSSAPAAAPQVAPRQNKEGALDETRTTVVPSSAAPLGATASRVPGQPRSPLPTWTMTAPTSLATPTDVAAPTSTPTPLTPPTATSTLPPTETPPPTHTLSPTATPFPTATPVPTETPRPTHTPTPTNTPAPTNTPTAVPPLTMDWVSTEIRCISSARWAIRFWLTASGGIGEYTFYHDIQRLHGPHPADGFGYELTVGTGAPAVGTFAVESGTQRVESKFWIARPDCGY